jgi:enamine deaminase RidA (YjgF/YER057c/UK114 family)
METQIRQTFEQIATILASVGGSFRNVVMIRGYFLDLARDMPVFRKVREEFLVPPYPASTIVGVTELAIEKLQVEIEAIAIL